MRKPRVKPSGIRIDRFTGEQIGTPRTTKAGRVLFHKTKLVYLYPWTLDARNDTNALQQLREVCHDALNIEDRIRSAAFEEAAASDTVLAVFSLKHASDQLNLDNVPTNNIEFFHAVQEKAGMDDGHYLTGGELKSAVEAARGYELGERPLLAYQSLLDASSSFFLISGAIQVSDASPGFFDPQPQGRRMTEDDEE